MTLTAHEAFEKGTGTFNAHDIVAFAHVLADDVVFRSPNGMWGRGKAACVEFYGSWVIAFPDAHVDVHHARQPEKLQPSHGSPNRGCSSSPRRRRLR
jgi:hypothetical protein